MQIETKLGEQLGRYLDLAVSEAKVTASNMANIDTPGYRTMGFDFGSEMRGASSQDPMAMMYRWIGKGCVSPSLS
jgi:flagellar basal-body rod protein FlgB